MKIRPVGAVLFHADGQTETYMKKLVVAFLKFANACIKSLPHMVSLYIRYQSTLVVSNRSKKWQPYKIRYNVRLSRQ
jgi:hypothetical protein